MIRRLAIAGLILLAGSHSQVAAGTPLALSAGAAGPRPATQPLASVATTPPELLTGVRRIAAPGVPGPLCVYGPAQPVVVGDAGGGTRLPVVAAGYLGAGRVVAFGHDGYFGAEALGSADTGRLMQNALRWAAGKARPRVAVVGQPGLARWLSAQGWAVTEVSLANPASLAGHDVVAFVAWAQSAGEMATVDAFVRRGGGLVAAVTGWGWAQLHPDRDLQLDMPGNRLLASAGIQWSNEWLEETDQAGGYSVPGPPSELTAGDAALAAAVAHARGTRSLRASELAQVSRTLVANAVCAPPDDELFLPQLRAQVPEVVVPSPSRPIRLHQVLERAAIVVQTRDYFALPPERARPHPATEVFPGPVPADAPRLAEATIELDTSIPDWHSTGYYAPPGEAIALEVPSEIVGRGYGVRIGAHTDTLWGVTEPWTRMPEISRWWPIAAREMRLVSPFGGLIYLTVPPGAKGQKVAVTLTGVVAAPVYRPGDDATEWQNRIRHLSAPWGEIVGREMIITTPAEHLRDLDDPGAVAAAWDRLLDLNAELAGAPARRARPERFVDDQQLAAGYMHSGYPLMCHLDQARNLVDAKHLTSEGNWGFFHEVGHNHQSELWTFEGTVEVTVNLFTLYAFEYLVGIPPLEHERGSVAFVRQQLAKMDFARPDFARWKSDPFLALAMYLQLQHAFGWDAFRRVFAEYRDLPPQERPVDDAAKRDQWLVRFSRTVGRNLGPFFQAWGVPTSAQARSSLADLPVWMPRGFPPGYDLDPTPTPTTGATATAIPSATPTVPPTAIPTATSTPQATGPHRDGGCRLHLPLGYATRP